MAAERKRLSSLSSSYQPSTLKNGNKATNDSSDCWNRKKKELKLSLQSNYNVLPESPPFQAICIKAAELEAYSRYPNSDRDEDKVQKDVCRFVNEEISKINQARLAIQCARLTAHRLLGDNKTGTTKGVSESWSYIEPPKTYGQERLCWRINPELTEDEDTEKKGVIKLTGE
ncbi:hypothetical protein MKW98_014088 [Papaver atlanticum]|uniref:Uncharacterized protein n=1 Tax=Papaver atlanticum TaxID=357466 RepID=A0AAD4XGV6_9MAGN|nr:hypothetical protein MKW98_014088 [Papaver atlanticum]